MLSASVSTGFLSVHVLTSANWDAVGHASVWNERSRAATGQTSEECVFYRQKDNPSVSDSLSKITCVRALFD